MTFIDSLRPPSTPAARNPVARRLMLAGVVGLTAVSISACGSTTPSPSPSEPVTAAVAASASPSPSPTASPMTLDIDRSFWHSGFEVTLGRAVFTPTAAGGEVIVDASLRNDGPKTASFTGELALESAGVSVQAAASASDLPVVPGAATGTGTLAFEVGPEFDLSAAVLRVGDAGVVQSVIAFGDAVADIGNEPVELAWKSASGRAGSVRVTLSEGVVRSDDPLTHRQLEPGHALVDLTFDVHRYGGAHSTTFIGTDNLRLRLPDGTTVAVRGDGISNPAALLAPGATIHDLHVRFEVPAPAEGRYSLVVSSLTPDPGHHTARIPFQVELG